MNLEKGKRDGIFWFVHNAEEYMIMYNKTNELVGYAIVEPKSMSVYEFPVIVDKELK